MVWAAIWQDGKPQALGAFSTYRGAPDALLDALTLCLEIAMPRRRRVSRCVCGRALRTVTGASRSISCPTARFGCCMAIRWMWARMRVSLRPGQILVLRMVLCGRGRHDVIDALNADTGTRHRFRLGWRPHPGWTMPIPRRPVSPRWRAWPQSRPCRRDHRSAGTGKRRAGGNARGPGRGRADQARHARPVRYGSGACCALDRHA
jgi:hypothetical protein